VIPNASLDSPSFGSPVHKIHHVRSIFPGKPQEFSRVHILRFRAKKSLKSPAQVRALPRFGSIPASNVPVVSQCLKHRSCTGITARSNLLSS
jgi:hypothetical protein